MLDLQIGFISMEVDNIDNTEESLQDLSFCYSACDCWCDYDNEDDE